MTAYSIWRSQCEFDGNLDNEILCNLSKFVDDIDLNGAADVLEERSAIHWELISLKK